MEQLDIEYFLYINKVAAYCYQTILHKTFRKNKVAACCYRTILHKIIYRKSDNSLVTLKNKTRSN